MIDIKGQGSLRNTVLELVRALEVVQSIAMMRQLPRWELQYGEIPLAGNRVDGILTVDGGDRVVIAIEVVSSEKDIARAESKLKRLMSIGEIDAGYIYIRHLEEVERDVIPKLKLLKEVSA